MRVNCCVASDKHLSFKCVPKNASVHMQNISKIVRPLLAAVSVNVLGVYCCSLGVFVLVHEGLSKDLETRCSKLTKIIKLWGFLVVFKVEHNIYS